MSLLEKRDYYKPFSYPWAFEAYKTQRAINWIVEEIAFDTDVHDYNQRMSEPDRHTITQIMRFFVQGDVDIADAYVNRYLPMFPAPEVRMMLTQFAATESLHIHAYSTLLDTLGLPEVEYHAFASYKEMREKHEFFYRDYPDLTAIERSVLDLCNVSYFGEGLFLFASFAILLSFSRPGGRNLMNKMGRVVTWSIRDEQLHVESMGKLFHTFLDENPKVWTPKLKKIIYDSCREVVELEDHFIDLAFEIGDLCDITAADIKSYIRFIADRRLNQIGLKAEYGVKKNPIPWIEDMVNADEFVNFFETEVTEYSSGAMTGTFAEANMAKLFTTDRIEHFIRGRKTLSA
jgi:ribonucleoside-diphosphate reductase beta chain